MEAISPVVPGLSLPECYIPVEGKGGCRRSVPGILSADGYVLTRWRLTWREALRVFLSGDLWLWVKAIDEKIQAVAISTESPATARPKG